jgi:hypothetical protein
LHLCRALSVGVGGASVYDWLTGLASGAQVAARKSRHSAARVYRLRIESASFPAG